MSTYILSCGKRAKALVIEAQANGCHYCISHCRNTRGYTRIKHNGKMDSLHRIMYTIHIGNIPKGMEVRHKCDNPRCCNIEHLEIGTHDDNMKDMKKRGRAVGFKGERNPKNKLSENQVKEIIKSQDSSKTLAVSYKVSLSTIRQIRTGKVWSHLKLANTD